MNEDTQYEQDLDLVLASVKKALLEMNASNLRFGEFGTLVRASDKLSSIEKMFLDDQPDEGALEYAWKALAAEVLHCLVAFYDGDKIDEINKMFEEAEIHDSYNINTFPGGIGFMFTPGL